MTGLSPSNAETLKSFFGTQLDDSSLQLNSWHEMMVVSFAGYL